MRLDYLKNFPRHCQYCTLANLLIASIFFLCCAFAFRSVTVVYTFDATLPFVVSIRHWKPSWFELPLVDVNFLNRLCHSYTFERRLAATCSTFLNPLSLLFDAEAGTFFHLFLLNNLYLIWNPFFLFLFIDLYSRSLAIF